MAAQNRPFLRRNIVREGFGNIYERSRGRYPVSVGGLTWLLQSVLQSAALSVRVFLRRKIGLRSFDFALVYAAFCWVRSFLFTERIGQLFRGTELNSIDRIFLFFKELWVLLMDIFGFGIGQGSSLIYGYSFIILALGLIHFIQSMTRNWKRKRWFTYHRGESVFFDWLEGAPLGGNLKITETTIRIFIEPLFLFLVGFLLIVIIEQPVFGVCIILSAVALLIEEYIAYRAELNVLLDQLDAQYIAEKMEVELARYEENNMELNQSNVLSSGATIANDEDVKVMSDFIKKQANQSPRQLGAKV